MSSYRETCGVIDVDPQHPVEWVRRSVVSLLGQTHQLDAVIIAPSAPLAAPIIDMLSRFDEQQSTPLVVVAAAPGDHSGLPAAWSWIAHNSCADGALIARLHAGDVAHNERIARQVDVLARGFAAVGSAAYEFDAHATFTNPLDMLAGSVTVATIPGDKSALKTLRAKRKPVVNTSTVMVDSRAVAAAGGWIDSDGDVDNLLWERLWDRGAKITNIAQPLTWCPVTRHKTLRGLLRHTR